MGLRKVTDPDLLKVLDAESEPTLQERKGETDIVQGGASAANSAASAEETRTLLPIKQRKMTAEAAYEEKRAEQGPPKSEAQLKLDTETDAKAKRGRIVDSLLGNVEALYKKDIEGQPLSRLGGLTEYLDFLPENERFSTAGSNILPLIRPLVAQSAKEGDSNIEMTVFQSYIPNANDTDVTIEYKMGALRTLIDGMLQGKPPSQIEKEGELGLIGTVTDEGSAAPPAAALGADGGAGGSGGGGPGGGGPPPDNPSGLTVADLVAGRTQPKATVMARLSEGAGSIVEMLGSVPGALGGDMLGQGWSNLMRKYGYDMPENYDMGEELRKLVGLRDNQTGTDSIIKGGTAALTGSLAAKGIGAMLQPGAWKNAMTTLGASPGRDMAAGAGAGLSADVAREYGAGPLGQTAAALLGGGLTYGGASAAKSLMQPKVPTRMAELATKYGVDYLPADSGSSVAKLMTGAARGSPISATPVVEGAKNAQSTLARAVGREARQVGGGEVPTTDVSGEFLRDAAKRYSASTKDIGNSLYEKAWADPIVSQLQVPARASLAKVDEMLARLNKAPAINAEAIRDLQRIKGDLSGGMTPQALHDLRSEISQGVFDGKLRSSKDQGRMKAIGGSLTDDMLGYLDSLGLKPAADKIRRGDRYHQDRVEHIDEVLQPIIGKGETIGGEQIVQRIEGMARGRMGGNKRLSRMMSNMAEPERQQVRATLIDRIGRVSEGAEGDDAFSATKFIDNWNKMTPQAKATLFKDGGLHKSLDDLAELASGMRSSDKLARYDPTNKWSLGSNVGVQGAIAATAGVPAFLASAGAQYITGRMLASPKFARALAKAPTVKDPRTFIEGLATIGAREPALRADISLFQQHLNQSLGQSPLRAVASEEEEN